MRVLNAYGRDKIAVLENEREILARKLLTVVDPTPTD